MKLRTYTYVSRDSMLRTVELPEPEPPQIHDALLELCDAVVYLDEPTPGLMRATTIKGPDGCEYEPIVGETFEPFVANLSAGFG